MIDSGPQELRRIVTPALKHASASEIRQVSLSFQAIFKPDPKPKTGQRLDFDYIVKHSPLLR
jgi:hypothetical protein